MTREPFEISFSECSKWNLMIGLGWSTVNLSKRSLWGPKIILLTSLGKHLRISSLKVFGKSFWSSTSKIVLISGCFASSTAATAQVNSRRSEKFWRFWRKKFFWAFERLKIVETIRNFRKFRNILRKDWKSLKRRKKMKNFDRF